MHPTEAPHPGFLVASLIANPLDLSSLKVSLKSNFWVRSDPRALQVLRIDHIRHTLRKYTDTILF